MTRNLFAACILSLAIASIGNAQGPASSQETGAHYTPAQLKQLARSAHSPDQYRALAAGYGKQQDDYLKQAAEEKKEWERRSKNTTGILGKYPRPVDSARNLYEYYIAKASETGALQAKFNGLASSDGLVNAQ